MEIKKLYFIMKVKTFTLKSKELSFKSKGLYFIVKQKWLEEIQLCFALSL